MTTQKEAWELSWERLASPRQLQRLRLTPRNHHDREHRINDETERDAFKAGYLAAKAEQEATVRAAKISALKELQQSVDRLKETGAMHWRYSQVLKELLAKYGEQADDTHGG